MNNSRDARDPSREGTDWKQESTSTGTHRPRVAGHGYVGTQYVQYVVSIPRECALSSVQPGQPKWPAWVGSLRGAACRARAARHTLTAWGVAGRGRAWGRAPVLCIVFIFISIPFLHLIAQTSTLFAERRPLVCCTHHTPHTHTQNSTAQYPGFINHDKTNSDPLKFRQTVFRQFF